MTLPYTLVPIRKSNGDFEFIEAQPSELDWPDLRSIWAEIGITRPICFAPPEEKLDVFFSYACQTANAPISLGTVFNPGWSELFMDIIKHDCLVISAELSPYLFERRLFASHVDQLSLIVIVGSTNQSIANFIAPPDRKNNLRILPHPANGFFA
tara:strand:+ start:16129 stop:16590 length:462 start_codon:yes stop_codon:yes gene_type:complete